MSHTLGIDVGTYQTKAVLADAEGGIAAQAVRDHEMLVPRPGWAEHRPADWWSDLVGCVGEVLAGRDPRAVEAVAVSAIGPCLLPVDADGAPLTNAILYGVDARAEAEVAEMTEAIGPERILETCGMALTSQAVGPKILWLKRNRPEVWARTARLSGSTPWLVERLTGGAVIDHYTAANHAPFYDARAPGWTDALMPGVVDPATLPRLMWSADIAGTVTEAAAAETGLAPGTPVTCGTIDAAAEAVSVGVERPGDLMMMYGSTVFLVALAEGVAPHPALWSAPWLHPGRRAVMGGMATSGTLTHWFRDAFARELPREEAFAALVAEAEAVEPGAGGLLFLPYFSGERTPIHDPRARGAFFGLNLTHGRGAMFRAVLEGIAHGTRHALEAFAEAGAAPRRAMAVGGGTRNALWMRATSDVAGLPQLVRERTVGAAYGDAMLARMALGGTVDVEAWNPVAREVEPRRHEVYDAHHPLWRDLYRSTRHIAAAL